jgi:hypothetical protein
MRYLQSAKMISVTWKMLKDTVLSFIEDEALTRGAAIAFYTATSIAMRGPGRMNWSFMSKAPTPTQL